MNPDLLLQLGLGPVWRLRPETSEAVAGSHPELSSQRESVEQIVERAEMGGASRTKEGQQETLSSVGDVGWSEIEARIQACRACRLCEARKHVVPGVGDHSAQWMFVGEGPGAEEDEKGVPFVGQAGKLFDAMLASLGLNRAQGLYIANAVKCRPPHNRTPERDEIEACLPFLKRQIELVQPKLLIALGRTGAEALLAKEDIRMSAVRGRVHRYAYADIPVIVTYHPAYLLRSPNEKLKAWEDLCLMRRTVPLVG